MTRPRILVSGASGLLGPYLAMAAKEWGDVFTTSRTSGDFPADLIDPDETKNLIKKTEPYILVNAAGLTDVDLCEKDPHLASDLNTNVTENLAGLLSSGACFVCISTDQVYPDSPGPHFEGAEAPVNVYGRSKLAGEKAALAHPGGLVLRTNFFGPSQTPGRNSLSDFFIDNFRAKKEVTLFSDVFFSPLHMKTLCDLIFRSVSEGLRGIYNLGSREGTSKAEFGFSVARHFGLSTEKAILGKAQLHPDRAKRPADMRMDVTKIETALKTKMPTLEEEISRL
ncbi:MAG: SDR family oxidoreductase [Nitrospinota bacterium]|jgi:dTDP-4-dehydrorhamnose reductase|nr:SDR family oxidoreductase [Nitrospinota bacterium]